MGVLITPKLGVRIDNNYGIDNRGRETVSCVIPIRLPRFQLATSSTIVTEAWRLLTGMGVL